MTFVRRIDSLRVSWRSSSLTASGSETTSSTAYDKLTVTAGSTTLATYSNLNHNSGYAQKTFDLSSLAGQTVTLNRDGAGTLLSVTNAGKTASVDIPSSEALSDAALASAIERQLREAGLDLKVTVTNGRIAIDTP